MSAKKLFFISFGLLFALQSGAQAQWSPSECTNKCTAASCKDNERRIECMSNCEAPYSCPPLDQKGGNAVGSAFKKAMAPLPPRPLPTAPKASSAPLQNTDSSKESLAENIKFFKNFTADIAAALNFTRCISDSIVISADFFEANVVNKIKAKMARNKLSFKSYKDYLIALNSYYASLISPNLTLQTEEMSKIKENADPNEIYGKRLTEYLAQNRRLAQQIAIQLPGYANIPTASSGESYLKSLPEKALEKLKTCVSKVEFIASPLKNFKKEFFMEKNAVHIKQESVNVDLAPGKK